MDNKHEKKLMKYCYKVISSVDKTKNKRDSNCWQEFAILKRVIRACFAKMVSFE